MKTKILIALILFAGFKANAQKTINPLKNVSMKVNAGITTNKIQESKAFYTEILGFTVTFENEFYLLLGEGDQPSVLSFLLPNHPTQQPLFQPQFQGEGMYLTIEVDDVDAIYQEVVKKNIKIEIDIRNEPWGDRHFAIKDPNGIGIDIVEYHQPE